MRENLQAIDPPKSEAELAALCAQLGADRIPGYSSDERQLVDGAGCVPNDLVNATRIAILDGADPVGTWFCALRSPAERRERGATYTPQRIIKSMIGWAKSAGQPTRIVDPGAGSGRFLVEAGRCFPDVQLIGVEIDPLAALMARANLAVSGLQHRAQVHLSDYRSFALPATKGPTLFVGNPPYLRHHDIEPHWKTWLSTNAERHNLSASQLAGLHVHFFLATLNHSHPGDLGAFITASEWLDVNYGQLVRDLLAGPLGIERLDVLDPKIEPFADAQTTAVISCFRVGNTAPTVNVRKLGRLDDLESLSGGHTVTREHLSTEKRWSTTRRNRSRDVDVVELGELCRVHRGQVTGANAVWIVGPNTPALPSSVLRPAITKARELFNADGVLLSDNQLRRVVDLPADFASLSRDARRLVDWFVVWARNAGAHDSYTARHRSPWWAVKLREPAPILATYMARRPPAFVRNLANAAHINIAHGLYPRERFSVDFLDALATYLAQSVSTDEGRTYAGGLTKFEPKEMERLLVPVPRVLEQLAADKRAA